MADERRLMALGVPPDLAHDQAEIIFAPDMTVADLSITGGGCFVGWDQTSVSAELVITDSLTFTASGGEIGKIAEFRSGRFGTAGPSVASSVTLASGLAVTVDATGLPAGTYDLIDADSLTDNGAILPAGVTVTGGRLVYTKA